MAGDNFHHVRDFPFFELPGGVHLDLPNIGGFQVSRFMVLQVIAGLLTLFIFKGLAKRVSSGEPTRGRFWNFWEAIALFVRDEVVRPTIGDGHHDHGHDDGHHGDGHHDDAAHGHGESHAGHHADQYLPFVWTCFFYVLICNLLGAVPMLGSATGSICVTGVFAVSVFVYNVFHGSKQFGFIGFWKNQCPNLGLSGFQAVIITAILWPIEVIGLLIKHGVLAIRLYATIMGGHTVLGVILGFIAAPGIAGTALQGIVIPASIGGQIFIGMLELFVAFLQAYVFAYLATIFLAAATHEH
ncbi:ATP synthase F0 subunit A [bacterium]|nr:ATP synthase F0 subunit A [bacterium]